MKMNKVMIALAVALPLLTGACSSTPYSDVGTVVGAAGGGAGGWFGTSKILDHVGNLNPTQRKIAQAGGGVVGALLGGVVGRSIGKPWDQQNAIDANRNGIADNREGIISNRNMIGQNADSIGHIGRQNNNRVVYYQAPPQNVVVPQQAPQNGNNLNANCKIQRNYVVCNSN